MYIYIHVVLMGSMWRDRLIRLSRRSQCCGFRTFGGKVIISYLNNVAIPKRDIVNVTRRAEPQHQIGHFLKDLNSFFYNNYIQKHVEKKLACTEISPKDAFHYVMPVRCDRNSAHLIFVTSVSQLHYDLLSLGNRHELTKYVFVIEIKYIFRDSAEGKSL